MARDDGVIGGSLGVALLSHLHDDEFGRGLGHRISSPPSPAISEQPDEVATAGEAYFFPAGHVLVYEEPTKALEINPAYALGQCMDAMARAAEKMMAQYSQE